MPAQIPIDAFNPAAHMHNKIDEKDVEKQVSFCDHEPPAILQESPPATAVVAVPGRRVLVGPPEPRGRPISIAFHLLRVWPHH